MSTHDANRSVPDARARKRGVRRLGRAGSAGVLVTVALAAAAWVPVASAARPACVVVNTNAAQSYRSLQAAVDAATAGQTLFVKGTCTGSTTIETSLTITGQSNGGKRTATLDGDQQGVVLQIAGVTVTLNTLTITNGNGPEAGGISNQGTVNVNNSTITDNTAADGAGIDNSGTVNLNSSTITGNTAAGSAGGGIFNVFGTVNVNGNSTITGNNGDAEGGGIWNYDGAVTLNDTSTITDNTANLGGGISNDYGWVTMNDNSTITGNTANSTNGGGGINNNSGTLNGAVPGTGGNVYDNTPDDIYP